MIALSMIKSIDTSLNSFLNLNHHFQLLDRVHTVLQFLHYSDSFLIFHPIILLLLLYKVKIYTLIIYTHLLTRIYIILFLYYLNEILMKFIIIYKLSALFIQCKLFTYLEILRTYSIIFYKCLS